MKERLSIIVLVVFFVLGSVLYAGGATEKEEGGSSAVVLTIWHGFIETEEALFREVVSDYMVTNPEVRVELLAVPFDQLEGKYLTEASAGGAPTMIVGPQDRMARYEEAGLLTEIEDSLEFLGDLVPAAVDGGRIDGKLVGIPVSNKVVALYYNRSIVPTPPQSFEELLLLAEDHGLALTGNWFHNYMWGPAFGSTFMDSNNKVVIDSPEGSRAYSFFRSVASMPGVVVDSNDGDMDTLFRQGEVAFRIQGPWASGDTIRDLGIENVGVTKVPRIQGADFPRPWNQSEMISISVDSSPEEVDAAIQFLAFFTNAENQRKFLVESNWIPANSSVDISSNPVVGGFLEQVKYSDPFPVVSELGATWEPMGDAITKILEGVAPANLALKEAAELINTVNGK